LKEEQIWRLGTSIEERDGHIPLMEGREFLFSAHEMRLWEKAHHGTCARHIGSGACPHPTVIKQQFYRKLNIPHRFDQVNRIRSTNFEQKDLSITIL